MTTKTLHRKITSKGHEEQERAMFGSNDKERKPLNKQGAGFWDHIMNQAQRETIAEEEKELAPYYTGFFY